MGLFILRPKNEFPIGEFRSGYVFVGLFANVLVVLEEFLVGLRANLSFRKLDEADADADAEEVDASVTKFLDIITFRKRIRT